MLKNYSFKQNIKNKFNNFYFPTLFIIGGMIFGILVVDLSAQSREDIDYQIEISKAYNAIEKDELAEAGKIAKILLKKDEHKADVFYILGEVHYRSGLIKTAVDYYSKADENFQTFISPDDHYNMLWKLISGYQQLKQETDAIKIINRIIDESFNNSDPIDFNRGKAYYRLALTFRSLGKWGEAHEFILKAIQNEYMQYNAYLLLLDYFASYTQDEINLHFARSIVAEDDTPTRESAFLYYYRNWQESPVSPSIRKQFDDNQKIYGYSPRSEMMAKINQYADSLKRAKRAKRFE